MRKQNELTLYEGGLIVLLIFASILLLVVVSKSAKNIRKKYGQILASEKIAIPHYTDDELLERYYQIEIELQETLDDLESTRAQAMRRTIEDKTTDHAGGAAGGFAKGFSKGFDVSAIEERLIRIKIKLLRQIKVLFVIEINKRGLR